MCTVFRGLAKWMGLIRHNANRIDIEPRGLCTTYLCLTESTLAQTHTHANTIHVFVVVVGCCLFYSFHGESMNQWILNFFFCSVIYLLSGDSIRCHLYFYSRCSQRINNVTDRTKQIWPELDDVSIFKSCNLHSYFQL